MVRVRLFLILINSPVQYTGKECTVVSGNSIPDEIITILTASAAKDSSETTFRNAYHHTRRRGADLRRP